MRVTIVCLGVILALGGCRVSLRGALPPAVDAPGAAPVSEPLSASTPTAAVTAARTAALGRGAAPGNARGPGGFVSRGNARNFYTGPGGRLWYYMNHYYWAPESAPRDDLWIKATVVEEFRDLRTWPDGAAAAAPDPKVTVEYWEIGPTGRSVRLDNHKDYCLLSEEYTAGAITVEVTLTLGRLEVKDARGRWGRSRHGYVLQSRNYSGGGGIGADRARFRVLPTEAETVWGYRVPWSTHPQRLTRSSWQRLALPGWNLRERRPPRDLPAPVPVTTPRGE